MPILDKNLLLSEIEERLNYYVPANTVRQIINDAGISMEGIQFAYYHDTLETIKNIVEELYFSAESAKLSNRSQEK